MMLQVNCIADACAWDFDEPLRVCFSTEVASYTSICETNITTEPRHNASPDTLHSKNECPGKPYCGLDADLWECVPGSQICQ